MSIITLVFALIALAVAIYNYVRLRRVDREITVEGEQITFRNKDNEVFFIIHTAGDTVTFINKDRKVILKTKASWRK